MKKNAGDKKTSDLDEIIQVYDLMVRENLVEINWEKGRRKLLIRRKSSRGKPAENGNYDDIRQSVPPVDETTGVVKEPEEEKGTVKVESPMNGVFYRSPSPESQVFAKEGDVVSAGQTICIIEAMKSMNEIKADCEGRIMKIKAKDGETVTAGQPLFLILPGK